MEKDKICRNCGEHTTRHPSELCARCLRKASIPIRLCTCCEARRTRDESGMCYVCRSKASTQENGVDRIEEAISRYESTLMILKAKAAGKSFRVIAKELGIPKSTVANQFFAATFKKSRGASTWHEDLSPSSSRFDW